MTRPEARDRDWWKEAAIYEIYPRSFNDSDGDGVGDLAGIAGKLDYLDDLGIDAVWLTPVYDSPLGDFGYDIRDYRQILDDYGTMDDWERVRDGLHERDIRLVMDLVANHTSDEHEWFQQSRREVDPYTDYYIWRESDDGPPNNWESLFGGPAWTYDEVRGEYYLHLFDEKQPDLNWRNPAVREDIYEVMRWWLEKDVDGFRMDVINLLSKPEGLPDGEPSEVVTGSEHFINGPNLGEYLREMHDRVLSAYDVVTVGEMPGASVDDARTYAGSDGPLDMVFHFEHMRLDSTGNQDPWDFQDWKLSDLKETFTRWQEGLYPDSWNALYLNNHDQPRQVSRFGDDEEYREESATLLCTFLHTLRGTPFVYQGEEIGMTNVPFEDVDEIRDVEAIRYVERMLERDDVENFDDISEAVMYGSRDNARTPVQWSTDENGGFTTGDPWLKVNPNHPEINVETARGNPGSIWEYYRRLIELRKAHPVLVYGRYELLAGDHPRIYAYERIGDGEQVSDSGPDSDDEGSGDGQWDDERALVVLNFSGDRAEFEPADYVDADGDDARLLVANYDVPRPVALDHSTWQPYEARVYLLD
ncbi:glucohydrolase [Halobacteriales archaeon QH_2_65_14]|nr:MAG: glucohydrolase [Halobacteriales archaeon QH_2_65_14]